MRPFRGRIAVVTGAASGIGRALALGLAERGAHLAISDVDDAGLAVTAARVRAADGAVHVAHLDVSERAAVRRYATRVAEHFGAVHQVYNNAGIGTNARPLAQTDDYDDFERLLAVNLWGVIYGTREFLPHLIRSGEGQVVNVSSLNGYLGQPRMAAYCTSKFGVRGFTEALRAELLAAGHPVRVAVVHPGGVATGISDAALARSRAADPAERAAQVHRTRVYNERLLRMPPARAAGIILDGVAAGRGRILVGGDARATDALVRLMPATYPRLTAWFERLMFGDGREGGHGS